MDNSRDKTQPRYCGVRNEESCAHRSGVVVVPVEAEPAAVPAPPAAVPVEITDVQVAIGVAIMCEVPSMPLLIEDYSDLQAVSDSAS